MTTLQKLDKTINRLVRVHGLAVVYAAVNEVPGAFKQPGFTLLYLTTRFSL